MSEEESVHVVYETIAEAVGALYLGKVIQVYFGENGGTTNYADYDVEQKIYVEGKVLWSKGNVIMLECIVQTPAGGQYPKKLLINTFAVSSIMEKGTENITIAHLMQGTRR